MTRLRTAVPWAVAGVSLLFVAAACMLFGLAGQVSPTPTSSPHHLKIQDFYAIGVAGLTCPLVGAFILSRRPRNPVGLVFHTELVGAVAFAAYGDLTYATTTPATRIVCRGVGRRLGIRYGRQPSIAGAVALSWWAPVPRLAAGVRDRGDCGSWQTLPLTPPRA